MKRRLVVIVEPRSLNVLRCQSLQTPPATPIRRRHKLSSPRKPRPATAVSAARHASCRGVASAPSAAAARSRPVVVLRQPQLELCRPDDFHALRDDCCSSPDSTLCSGSEDVGGGSSCSSSGAESFVGCLGGCAERMCYDDFSAAAGRIAHYDSLMLGSTTSCGCFGLSEPPLKDENFNDVYWSGE